MLVLFVLYLVEGDVVIDGGNLYYKDFMCCVM